MGIEFKPVGLDWQSDSYWVSEGLSSHLGFRNTARWRLATFQTLWGLGRPRNVTLEHCGGL